MAHNNNFKYELFKFAFSPNYNDSIKYLAENLLDDEEWDISDVKVKKYSILKNYLVYTYKKSKQEGKIKFTSDNKNSCFNTGLVTSNLEDIFALFEEYRKPGPNTTTAFCFKTFVKKRCEPTIKLLFLNIMMVVFNFYYL